MLAFWVCDKCNQWLRLLSKELLLIAKSIAYNASSTTVKALMERYQILQIIDQQIIIRWYNVDSTMTRQTSQGGVTSLDSGGTKLLTREEQLAEIMTAEDSKRKLSTGLKRCLGVVQQCYSHSDGQEVPV